MAEGIASKSLIWFLQNLIWHLARLLAPLPSFKCLLIALIAFVSQEVLNQKAYKEQEP